MKRDYLTPKAYVIDLCSLDMLAASSRMLNTEGSKDVKYVDDSRTGWGDLWK